VKPKTLLEQAQDGATMYLPMLSGAVALCYRWNSVKYNDRTAGRGLEFYSPDHCCWRGTNERDPEEFAATRLLPLTISKP
jgi:hypothetical protein